MRALSLMQKRRMIRGLKFALDCVKKGRASGLCFGLELARQDCVITANDDDYLCRWIRKQLGYEVYMEDWVIVEFTSRARKNGEIPYPIRLPPPYALRKPWVEWMIRHINAT